MRNVCAVSPVPFGLGVSCYFRAFVNVFSHHISHVLFHLTYKSYTVGSDVLTTVVMKGSIPEDKTL
jgi:hypothetical protein